MGYFKGADISYKIQDVTRDTIDTYKSLGFTVTAFFIGRTAYIRFKN